MKKIIFTILMMIGVLVARADSYSYLTFETTEGAKVSVPTSALTLTVSGTTLKVGTQSFVLSNLRKMYFSSTDETTGIDAPAFDAWDEATEIYDLQGHRFTKRQLRKGAYIIKTKKGNCKIVVR